MPEAFYLPRDTSRFVSTEHTAGPWDPGLQHAGPPSALLARAIEQLPSPWEAVVTRLSVDILGPVPVAELELSARVLRSGRSVELAEAQLAHDGRVAIRATAWKVRRADLTLPPVPDSARGADEAPPPRPDEDAAMPPGWAQRGYLAAMQWRVAAGSWSEPGPATVWGRMRVPLVPDEEPSGLQRLMTIADSGNGVSNVLPIDGWFFINPDLTVHLAAEPTGEWMCIDACTRLDPAGFGVAQSRLYDARRFVAQGAQALYVGPR